MRPSDKKASASFLKKRSKKLLFVGLRLYRRTLATEIVRSWRRLSGKLTQITKLMHDGAMNPLAKPVVLFAPRYGRTAGRRIIQSGAKLARTPEELVALLKSMRGK